MGLPQAILRPLQKKQAKLLDLFGGPTLLPVLPLRPRFISGGDGESPFVLGDHPMGPGMCSI